MSQYETPLAKKCPAAVRSFVALWTPFCWPTIWPKVLNAPEFAAFSTFGLKRAHNSAPHARKCRKTAQFGLIRRVWLAQERKTMLNPMFRVRGPCRSEV